MNAISELINKLEISKMDFSRKTKIPYRTVQDWEAGNRNPTKYLLDLLNYRLGKTLYTCTEYRIYGLKNESITSKNIEEVKLLLHEEKLSDAELLLKYQTDKELEENEIYICQEIWIVKENLLGNFKYTVYIDNGQKEGVNTNDLQEAIRVAEQHAFIF